MASSAAAHRLSRLFPASAPFVRASRPTPTREAPADGAEVDSNSRRKPLAMVIKDLVRQRDPDKLVSEFIAASSASSSFRATDRIYEMAVSRLAAYGRRDGVTAIIDAQKPFLETSTEGFAARLIRLYSRASMPSHAAETFRGLPSRHKSTMTFNAVLTAYRGAGEFDALAVAFKEIPASHPSVVPSVYSYNILLHALCKKPDLPVALDAVTLMEKCGVSPNILSFNTLLNGFYNHGDIEGAEKVWEMMKERNVAPNTKSYYAKLRSLVAEGRIGDAVAVFERMEKDGPKPDPLSYNELIRWYCKDGRLEEAKKLYEDMAKNECSPNRLTYQTLVPCLLEAGELDYALRCCHELFNSTYRMDCSMLQEVVIALVTASRVKEATKIVQLGWENHYPRNILKMPLAVEDDKVITERNGEGSISEEGPKNA
ncbi:hypothetical protein ABZP36_026584 [Zizania latifolia]